MRFTAVFALVWVSLTVGHANAGIRDTKHNLSVHGPGTIRAESETRICIFCHAPHHASPAGGVLWNRNDSTATYTPYQSATLRANVGQPTGASKLCLSCHDGTVALGETLSEPAEIGFVGGVRFLPPGSSLLGTNLDDDHPVSFVYDSALAAANPGLVDPTDPNVAQALDAWGQVQCTACHDPHEDGFGKFLVASRLESAICRTCHAPADWPTSAHATSLVTWNGSGTDPWPDSALTSVKDNACGNCHQSHGAQSDQWLLHRAGEEDNCLLCHDGGVAATDIQSDITAPFRHPVELTTDIHAPNEDPTLPMATHVECTDCHNPHEATDTTASAPIAPGPLLGVTGVDQAGQVVNPVAYEYEVCFKCHGVNSMTQPVINRMHLQNDKRLQFDVGNPSYHPVVNTGASSNVPSLLPPLTESSVIYCGDCHASDRGPGADGSGPAGPHGSIYPHILERQYNTVDGVPYDRSLYDLCFKCHSVTSILNDDSFDKHKKHIENVDAGCGVCHDPHGISSTQGNSTNNSHLINFDLTVVAPVPGSGRLEFIDEGVHKGSCYLTCHGKAHNPMRY